MAVEDEGAEGEDGGDEGSGDLLEAEVGLGGGVAEGEEEQDEQGAVGPADVLDGEWETRGVLERHGDAEQDEEGAALEQADEAQAADGVVEHGGKLASAAGSAKGGESGPGGVREKRGPREAVAWEPGGEAGRPRNCVGKKEWDEMIWR